MQDKLREKVRKFCQQQSSKGHGATELHRLGPTIAKKFRLSLREGCEFAKAWTVGDLDPPMRRNRGWWDFLNTDVDTIEAKYPDAARLIATGLILLAVLGLDIGLVIAICNLL
jgi:hypothetical protein